MFLSSLNLIGQTVFELESRNKNVDRRMDRQTDEKRSNEQTEFHQFRKEPSHDEIYQHVKFEFDRTNRFQVRVQKQKLWTDRQTSDTSI